MSTNLADYEGKKIIGWKKVRYASDANEWSARDAIVKLEISARTRRQQKNIGGKCRAASAKVLEIRGQFSGRSLKTGRSGFDRYFIYRVGEIVRPVEKYDNTLTECSSGIHFFLSEEQARCYHL